jgi:putative metallohydrolase (TIGR04338 family)
MRCQQDALYASERSVSFGDAFKTARDAEKWVNRVRDTRWFRDNFPTVEDIEIVRVNRRAGSVGGFKNGWVVCNMITAHLNQLFVCHEVAHGLVAARYGRNAHGPWFARVYLELVWFLMGPTAYLDLWRAFERDAIDHDPGSECTHAPRGAIILQGPAAGPSTG